MAYSSIGHIGYALIGLVAGGRVGVAAVALYLAVYLFMTLVTFGAILAMRVQGRFVEGISDLSGLSKTHPLLAMALGGAMFSMAGIPPLAGFFSKLYIFDAAIRSGFFILAIIGVVTSVFGAFYYLRIVKIMFFDDVGEALERPVSGALGVMLAVGAVFTFFFFMLPGPLVAAADAAAASLFPG
jgi:NADH-quinone oxidoreductase subunit N